MHTKRIAAGYGKKPKWIATARGPHPKAESIPLMLVVRDILGYADNAREAKKIITEGMVLVDKVPRTDPVYGVGLMDVIELPKAGKCFRVVPTKRGCELKPIEAKEAGVKPCKITGKRVVSGGRIQISLHDGTNFIAGKGGDFRTKDTVVLELPERKIKESLKFEKGAFGLVVKGRHIGEAGAIGEITVGDVVQKSLTEIGGFRTMTDYIFVIGRDKPMVTV